MNRDEDFAGLPLKGGVARRAPGVNAMRSLAMLTSVPALFAALSIPAAARPPVPAPHGHDLRGPALKEGLKVKVKTTIALKDATLGPDRTGGEERKLEVAFAEELEVELAAVERRQPTRLLTKVVTSETRQAYPDRPWPPEKVIHRLAGRTVVSRLERGEWSNGLDTGEANEQMKFILSLFCPWSPQDQLFPARAIPVGATWTLQPNDMTSFPCAFVSPRPKSLTVKGKGTFRAVEKHLGRQCAVVDYDLALSGKERNGRVWDVALKMTVYRSLREGINLKTVCDSSLRARAADAKPGFRMTGRQRLETVVTVKE